MNAKLFEESKIFFLIVVKGGSVDVKLHNVKNVTKFVLKCIIVAEIKNS